VPKVRQALHYDATTIRLHWLTAGLIVALWLSAQVFGVLNATPEIYLRSFHMTLGAALALVLAVRVSWRFTTGRSLPDADTGVMHTIARITHYFLYIVAGVTVLLGFLTVWMQGDSIWNLVTVPAYDASDKGLGHQMRGWHGFFANAILILAGLHAAAALFHQYVLRDGVLHRMLPRL
jgi:cytochrome b561